MYYTIVNGTAFGPFRTLAQSEKWVKENGFTKWATTENMFEPKAVKLMSAKWKQAFATGTGEQEQKENLPEPQQPSKKG